MNLADNRYSTLTVKIIQTSDCRVGVGNLALVSNQTGVLIAIEKPPAFKIVEHDLAHLFGDIELLRKLLDAPRSLRIASQQEQRLQLGHRLDLLSDEVANIRWQRIVQGFLIEVHCLIAPHNRAFIPEIVILADEVAFYLAEFRGEAASASYATDSTVEINFRRSIGLER